MLDFCFLVEHIEQDELQVNYEIISGCTSHSIHGEQPTAF